MPNYKGHLIGGCVAYGIAAYALCIMRGVAPSVVIAIEWFGCSIAGGMFPDIDIKSKGQKYFYWVVLLLLIFLITQERSDLIAVLSVFAVTPMLVRHRGLFHNIWFLLALVAGLLWALSLQFPALTERLAYDALFFVVGLISHLWLDMGTRKMLKI